MWAGTGGGNCRSLHNRGPGGKTLLLLQTTPLVAGNPTPTKVNGDFTLEYMGT
jgi:hypothetical protein